MGDEKELLSENEQQFWSGWFGGVFYYITSPMYRDPIGSNKGLTNVKTLQNIFLSNIENVWNTTLFNRPGVAGAAL